MSPLTLTGSDELELFYKKPFWFSYSSINKLLFSPRMFYSHYVLNQREDSTDAHLVAGRVLHCLLFEPEHYDKEFISMPGKFPPLQVLFGCSLGHNCETSEKEI